MITLACGINATGESSENMKFLNDRRRADPRMRLLINFCRAGAMEGERRVRWAGAGGGSRPAWNGTGGPDDRRSHPRDR
jgi:hypothetical protein